jgi:hypothetical protein
MRVLIPVVFLLTFVPPLVSPAQSKRGNIPIFGADKAALDFNFSPVVARLFESPMVQHYGTAEGSASICDVEGNLLFYTNGVSIWHRNHRFMRHGFNVLGLPLIPEGNSTTQDLIIPIPRSPRFYLVVTPGWQGLPLLYAVVDMFAHDGLGDVISKGHVLMEKPTEKLATIKSKNGDALWLLTHELGTNAFMAFRVTETGIDHNPVTTKIGTVHDGRNSENAIGYMAASHDGKTIAVAVSGDMGLLELFDFDNETGIVSNPRVLQLDKNIGSYGVVFSPDNSKLYQGQMKTRNLVQYDLHAGDVAAIKASAIVLGQGRGGLQVGPDQRIYVAGTNEVDRTDLGIVERPNERGTNAGFVRFGINLLGRRYVIGLPQMIYDPIEPDFFYNGTCIGDLTAFRLVNDKNVVSILWDFGDPLSSDNSSTESNPRHQFSAAGEFEVTCHVTLTNGDVHSYKQLVSIFSRPEVTMRDDTVVCQGARFRISPKVDASAQYFSWSNGSSTRTLESTQSGKFKLTASNFYCSTTDSITVIPLLPPKEILVRDTVICDDEVLHLEVPEDNAEFIWSNDITGRKNAITDAGPYSVTATNICGETRTDFDVSIFPQIQTDLPEAVYLCAGDTVVIDAEDENASAYLWNDGSDKPFLKVKTIGAYSVTVISRCQSIHQEGVAKYPVDEGTFLPNVITPNDDLLNDTFVLDDAFTTPTVTIYNRWGNELAHYEDYANTWPVSDVPFGVYYYRATDSCSKKSFTGEIHVLGE